MVIRHQRAAADRAVAAALVAVLFALLTACAGAPVPPTTWLRLPAELPAPAASNAPAAATVASDAWQLVLPVPMPAHLDHDRVFVPQGASSTWVRPLAGARWIEPLRDAVPRLLREDLATQLRAAGGGSLWSAPLPPGLAPARRLRVEITAFEITADGRALATRARWWIADLRSGGGVPVQHETGFATPPAGGEAEGWALAHRQAVHTLAERVAATMTAVR